MQSRGALRLALLLSIPVAVTLAGGVLAVFWRPSARVRSWLQHFAAGVVTAALAVELFPEIEARHSSLGVALGSFAAGGLVLFGLKWSLWSLERRRARKPEASESLGLLVATFVDVLVDGLVIGTGFANSEQTGAALALGLSTEMLFLGLSVATEPGGRRARLTPFLLTAALALVLAAGALAGLLVFSGLSVQASTGGLSFGAAALLYLVTEELLVEAHAGESEGPVGAGLLFLGFLAFWMIRRLTA